MNSIQTSCLPLCGELLAIALFLVATCSAKQTAFVFLRVLCVLLFRQLLDVPLGLLTNLREMKLGDRVSRMILSGVDR